MGKPLIQSFDSIIMYPFCIEPVLKYCKNISPTHITIANLLFKYLALYTTVQQMYFGLFLFSCIERWMDCLDGAVARRYDKISHVGHYLDKISDLMYRWITAIYLLYFYTFDFMTAPFEISLVILLCIGCPAVYVYDAYKGHIVDGSTKNTGYAIYVEDNATLLCLIQPLLLWRLQSIV